MGKYNKLFAQFAFTVLGFLGAVVTGGITATEWVNVAILTVGSAGVFAADNSPAALYIKAILSFLSAGLVVLQTVIVGGVSSGEWYQIAAAVLSVAVVYGLKNKEQGAL